MQSGSLGVERGPSTSTTSKLCDRCQRAQSEPFRSHSASPTSGGTWREMRGDPMHGTYAHSSGSLTANDSTVPVHVTVQKDASLITMDGSSNPMISLRGDRSVIFKLYTRKNVANCFQRVRHQADCWPSCTTDSMHPSS